MIYDVRELRFCLETSASAVIPQYKATRDKYMGAKLSRSALLPCQAIGGGGT